jgi:hypothetical protein
MGMAADRGLEAMNAAEINPNEWGLGKPCAGKPPARFDEGENRAAGNRRRGSLYSTETSEVERKSALILVDPEPESSAPLAE